jgi:hypothetical protein
VTGDDRLTRDVLHWLRDRRGSRRAAVRRIGFVVYVALLFSAIYGWPVVLSVAHSLETGHVRGAAGHAVIPSLPLGLACLFVIVLVGACRNALWRGPVVLSEADVVWLLPTALDRRRLLWPRAARAIGGAAVGGALFGALGAVLVNAVHPHVGGRLVAGMTGFGCVTAVVAVAAAAVVEGSERVASGVRRFWICGLGLSVLLGVLTAERASGRSWTWADRVVVWSGPWGWAAQLPVALDRGSAAAAPVALGLVVLLTAVVVVGAFRCVSRLTAESLRSRAQIDGRVGADLFVGDARSARLQIQRERSATLTTGFRVRVPRSRRLVIAWRDLIALLRAPGRAAWAAVFVVGATLVLGVGIAVSSTHDPAPAAIAVAVLCGYGAAAVLLEVGRVDNDRPEVTAQLPLRFSDIARRHVVVAAAVLAVFAAIAGAVVAGRFGAPPWPAAVAAIAAAPVLVGAASVNVYRKATPVEWLGVDPYGIGFSFVLFWLILGPLLALVALVPSTAAIFSALRHGSAPGAAIGSFVASCAVATAAALFLVTHRAQARARAAR